MNKKTIWLIIVGYTAISLLGAIFSGGGNVNLLAVSGQLVATVFYTRRFVPEKRGTVKMGLLGAIAVATVLGIVLALFSKNGILGNIMSNLSSCICAAVMLFVADGEKFDFMENCDGKKFWSILAVCLLLLPSVMFMVSGILTFVLSVVLIIAFSLFLFSNLDLSSMASPRQEGFRDDKGYVHTTGYDRDKANESYKANKE